MQGESVLWMKMLVHNLLETAEGLEILNRLISATTQSGKLSSQLKTNIIRYNFCAILAQKISNPENFAPNWLAAYELRI